MILCYLSTRRVIEQMNQNYSDFEREKYSDERLKIFTEYHKGQSLTCIYCGEIATIREHVPSKTLLKKSHRKI